MSKTTVFLVSVGVAAMVAAFGVSGALASEVGGTLSSGSAATGSGSGGAGTTGGSDSSSSSGGSMSGTVSGGSDSSQGGSTGSQAGGDSTLASNGGSASSSGGASGSTAQAGGTSASVGRHRSTISGSETGTMPIQSDGSLAQQADYSGTGGGYDPSLDSYLSSVGSSGSALSASDAVAYNGSLNPRALEAAAAAAGGGTSTGSKAMAVALVGLAVAGLSGYAVNSYLAYRRERGF